MSQLPPKTNVPNPTHPFEREGKYCDENAQNQMFEQSGSLPQQPVDAPVKNPTPYKNLKSYR